ncbi:MAG: hypothetical protein Q4D60_06200 [Eubacteriales bacterium]|nr:hypothetical protein [Eubacteriales bacterium]
MKINDCHNPSYPFTLVCLSFFLMLRRNLISDITMIYYTLNFIKDKASYIKNRKYDIFITIIYKFFGLLSLFMQDSTAEEKQKTSRHEKIMRTFALLLFLPVSHVEFCIHHNNNITTPILATGKYWRTRNMMAESLLLLHKNA